MGGQCKGSLGCLRNDVSLSCSQLAGESSVSLCMVIAGGRCIAHVIVASDAQLTEIGFSVRPSL